MVTRNRRCAVAQYSFPSPPVRAQRRARSGIRLQSGPRHRAIHGRTIGQTQTDWRDKATEHAQMNHQNSAHLRLNQYLPVFPDFRAKCKV